MSFDDGPGKTSAPAAAQRADETVSLRALWQTVVRRRRTVLVIEGVLLLLCLLYCLIAPNQYEARARVELRTDPASLLTTGAQAQAVSASILSAPVALETVAGVLRGDELAWRVILDLKLYGAPGFAGSFSKKFPGFKPDAPAPEAQTWLIERFERRLSVVSMPRTLLIDVRFRCRDPKLAAQVVSALIAAYEDGERQTRIRATASASAWLGGQLSQLKARVDQDDERLAEFEAQHGIVSSPETLANGLPGVTEHSTAAGQMDELSKDLSAATADRVLAEANFQAASTEDPESVIAADPRLQGGQGGLVTSVLEQIHTRQSQLDQERAQLSAEHGPNFPRVVEIDKQIEDLARQKQSQDVLLVDRFRGNLQAARDREALARKSLTAATEAGMRENRASTELAAMRLEAGSSREVYLRVLEKVEEAGLESGVSGSNLVVVDSARVPSKPVSPDLPVYLAITFFAGLWLAVGGALVADWKRSAAQAGAVLLAVLALAGGAGRAQAPLPSTSGVPAGAVQIPQSEETRSAPDARDAPPVWGGQAGVATQSGTLPAMQASAPIGPGDLLEVTEAQTPEFRSTVRVSAAGAVKLPLIGDVEIGGMDEAAAAQAIEAALEAKGMLKHPLVTVLVTAWAGQDVSVLGEVARPGVYPYAVRHRLLDLIAAAQGLGPNAGRLVNIYHASDPKTPHAVVLDPEGSDAAGEHNPELAAGDTVEVSRAGLVYVVGDVIRPGGFPIDPSRGLTVVQAITLAWGPTANAATTKAVLIREQKGGRTVTALNVKRLLRGQDPDLKVEDRDILYVPDSMAKNLVNRSLESAIQSAIGVTIYSGLVYSQRY
jgi:polysaccharide export outer membrane protein